MFKFALQSYIIILDSQNQISTRVEKHKIYVGHPHFEEIDALCFESKNLYNAANYVMRNTFIETSREKKEGKREHAEWVRYNEIQKIFQNEKQPDYMALPAKVSQQILMQLDKNWKSYFNSVKAWKADNTKFKGFPKLPHYKEKQVGRNMLVYTIQAISKKELKDGIIGLSKTNIKIKTRYKDIQQVRIVPKNGHYVIEVVHKVKTEVKKLDKNKVAGIDIGIRNLAAVTSNVCGLRPLLINGRPLKSINQFYNKTLAQRKSCIGVGSSKNIRKLTEKRTNKIDHYMHCASKIIVQHLVENEIGTLVIGKNDHWKTGSNMGDKTNQNFVQIPHARFIQMITYKAESVGITVHLTEEAHTSKCSFLDNEPVKHHDKYLGKRAKRGLFISSKGILINADCNGSFNIIKKVIPNAFAEGIEGVVVRPTTVSPPYQQRKTTKLNTQILPCFSI